MLTKNDGGREPLSHALDYAGGKQEASRRVTCYGPRIMTRMKNVQANAQAS